MSAKPILLCLTLAANALAADNGAPTPQPLATPHAKPGAATASGKPAPAARAVAPTVSETRVTLNADGTLSYSCVDTPNPKARAIQRALSPQSGGAPRP